MPLCVFYSVLTLHLEPNSLLLLYEHSADLYCDYWYILLHMFFIITSYWEGECLVAGKKSEDTKGKQEEYNWKTTFRLPLN